MYWFYPIKFWKLPRCIRVYPFMDSLSWILNITALMDKSWLSNKTKNEARPSHESVNWPLVYFRARWYIHKSPLSTTLVFTNSEIVSGRLSPITGCHQFVIRCHIYNTSKSSSFSIRWFATKWPHDHVTNSPLIICIQKQNRAEFKFFHNLFKIRYFREETEESFFN